MPRSFAIVISTVLLALSAVWAQVDKIVIPAGTPEDQAITAFTNENDAQKKQAMIEDFVQKFASNPAAVAYGNWQLAQVYQTAGDLPKALEYGDKALAASPHNMDILMSQCNIAQQMKNPKKVMEYAVRGGEAYQSIARQPKPEGMSDQDYQGRIMEDKAGSQQAYEFMEAAAFNVIAEEQDPKAKMAYIERFTPAFPGSRFEESVTQYAMYALGQLNDMPRLVAYGEKTLAANPNSLPTLVLLANAYAEDPKGTNLAKAVTYAQKAIEVAKADAPDADRSRKLSAGVAHSAAGYALVRQEKAAAAVEHFRAAIPLVKEDPGQYSTVLYRLGFTYAKLNKVDEARQVLTQCVSAGGPAQNLCKETLAKVNTARSKAR